MLRRSGARPTGTTGSSGRAIACATACPVDALKPHTTLTADELPFIELNRLYYAENPHADRTPLAASSGLGLVARKETSA